MKEIDKQYTDILDEFFSNYSEVSQRSLYTESENYVYCTCTTKRYVNSVDIIYVTTIVTLKKGDEFVWTQDFEYMKKELHPSSKGFWARNNEVREEMYNHITNNPAFIASMIF